MKKGLNYTVTIEYIVCRMDNTWFTHVHKVDWSYFLNTENLLLLTPTFMQHFELEGTFAFIGIYNATCEEKTDD
jgi:hypothetical protein